MSFIISPNMSLNIPVTGNEPGPDYANDVNNSLTIIDSHNHSLGSGIQINPAGLNINADLPINGNNLTLARTLRFQSQSGTLVGTTDLGCIYEVLGDLWYNNSGGTPVQITLGNSVFSTLSGISSGTATAAFAGSTLVVNANLNTPANIQAGSILLGNNSSGSNFLTLSPPSFIPNYSIVLPLLPAADASVVLMSTAGTMSAVDNSAYILPSGMIAPYGGTVVPAGWLLCNGAAISRVTYAALFSAVSTAYGAGDGATTFNLPDFRGQFLRGVTGTSTNDPNASSRTAMAPGGNAGNTIGSVQGYQIQQHTHADAGHTHPPAGGTNFIDNSGASPPFSNGGSGGQHSTTGVGFANIQNTGGSETRPINAYVNYIIKV